MGFRSLSSGSGGQESATATATTVVSTESTSPSVSVPTVVAVPAVIDRVYIRIIRVVSPVSKSAADAPRVRVSAGLPVSPVVRGLPEKRPLVASIRVPSPNRAKASFVAMGKIRSTAAGRERVPAFKASRTGVYTIRLSTPAGKAYYLKVKVTAKKSAKS